MPGPTPNRTEDLSRERSANRNGRPPITKGTLRPVRIPKADPDWHPIARMIWDGCKTSGQADWYQNSDWAMLYSICEDITRYKEPLINKETGQGYYKRSGQMLTSIYSALERLLITEGDRRRARIELSQPEPQQESAAVLALADYKDRLSKPEGA